MPRARVGESADKLTVVPRKNAGFLATLAMIT